jgi:hypothetical protein
MKLKSIGEGFMSQKLRETIRGDEQLGGVNRLPVAATGYDAGNRTAGNTQMPTGVPLKPRHRKYFGMEVKPSDTPSV